MSALTLSPRTFSPGEIAEIQAGQVEADLREEAGTEACEVLLARDAQGTLLGLLPCWAGNPAMAIPGSDC